jgi:hypothetical protein
MEVKDLRFCGKKLLGKFHWPIGPIGGREREHSTGGRKGHPTITCESFLELLPWYLGNTGGSLQTS